MAETNNPDGPSGIYVLPKADTSHIVRKTLDIPYAFASAFQKLDVYLPNVGSGPFPVILAVHGGAWMMCDKNDTQVLPMLRGLARGYAVVAVNYRLSSEARFPAQIQDLKAAIRWVRTVGQKQYSLDSERLALWGGSAGAHLSALAGLTGIKSAHDPNRIESWEALAPCDLEVPTDVRAVVSWYGPTDFLKMDTYLQANGLGPQNHSTPDSPESKLLGVAITQAPDLVRMANPETYVSSFSPPFFIQHGRVDSTVPYQHSLDLAGRLIAAIGPDKVYFELLPNAEHADPAFETKENVTKILDFLDRFCRG